ncbi:amidohydrolase family protein [Desulfococcus sp.]|uniref:amidohydrolase family protein n=1 Tax=Desulfococcus sp. TaxID=2025834 RepID=UPI003593FF85
MIIDFHVHLFSEAIREKRSAFFPSEPAFKLLYDSPKSRLVGAEDALRMMDAEGVDKSVVFGFPWRATDTFRRENDYIIETVHKYPDRFIGLACFDAMNRDAAAETERCLAAGLQGAGELAFYESGIDEAAIKALDPIMALCREHGRVVLIHTNEPVGHAYPGKSPNTLLQIYRMVQAFPENRIVLAHWGAGIFFYNLLKREVKEALGNVWYDTAASPFLYDVDIYAAAGPLAGWDRVLFGTDYPLLKPGRYFGDMDKSGISAEARAGICGGNAWNLLGL